MVEQEHCSNNIPCVGDYTEEESFNRSGHKLYSFSRREKGKTTIRKDIEVTIARGRAKETFLEEDRKLQNIGKYSLSEFERKFLIVIEN